MNSSETGGYLLPQDATLTGQAYTRLIQQFLVGVTGLGGTLVRPADQADPPPVPESFIDWLAFRLTSITPGDNAYQKPGDETLETQRHNTQTLQLMFYGPACNDNAVRFLDAIQISQNRDVIRREGVAVADWGEPLNMSEIVNGQTYRRCDVQLLLAREERRVFQIRPFKSVPTPIKTN